jgi:hypothetical protein
MPETLDFPAIAARVITDLEAITGEAPSARLRRLGGVHRGGQGVHAQSRQLMAIVVDHLRQV